jgi:hypothetical protein
MISILVAHIGDSDLLDLTYGHDAATLNKAGESYVVPFEPSRRFGNAAIRIVAAKDSWVSVADGKPFLLMAGKEFVARIGQNAAIKFVK